MRVGRVEGALDGGGVSVRRAARLPGPILHDHGNAGRATTLGWLFNKGNVEPHRVSRAEQEAEQQRKQRRRNDSKHELANGDDDQDQNDDPQSDEDQVMVGNIASGEIGLRPVDARGKLGELVVI